MTLRPLETLLTHGVAPGAPVAIMLCEDGFLVGETIDWLRRRGFRSIVALGPGAAALEPAPDLALADDAFEGPVEAAAAAARLMPVVAGRWAHVCWNGEFLFFPYCETRTAADLAGFLTDERRASLFGCMVDLYSDALGRDETAFSLDEVHFDALGWYGFVGEGQRVDVYGGLGWRFEEYADPLMLKATRPAFFKATAETTLDAELQPTPGELVSISCPWHHNPTAAVMSLRRAKRLRRHPKFSNAVRTFMWPQSRRFEWSSAQLMELGMMEPGQWF